MPPPQAPNRQEKRRHARKATQQAAQIRFAEGAAMACEIRDYCEAGLYVALPDARTPELALPALVGAAVEVAFSAGEGRAPPAFCLNGRVARVAPGGVGVLVPVMPDAALQALRAARAPRAAPPAGVAALAPHAAQALQQACTSQFRSFLDAVMQAFFQQATERLAQASQDEPSFLERSRYEAGAQEMRQARSRIEEDFIQTLLERVRRAGLHERYRAAPGEGGLALIDEAEFEDWLNLSTVIKQVETGVARELGEFEQHYSRLIGQPVERKGNPFGPETIGRAFQGAIQGLDFTHRMRSVLYKALGDALSSHAPALYRQLNQTLAALQPLAPERNAARATPPAAAAPDRGGKPKPDLADLADTLNRLYREGQSGQTLAPENAEYSLDRIMASIEQPGRAVPAAGHAPGGAALPSGVLGVVDRLQRAQRQLQGGEPVAPPAAGGSPASLDELLALLDSLPLASAGPGAAPSLTEQVDARMVAADGGMRRLAADHRQILDATAQLFSRARADFVPSSEMESLIKRLERPLLKLALRDTRFPATSEHPARQVLNLIEQFAVAADDQGKFFDAKLQRFLFLLVDRVCSHADADPGVYDMVRDNLRKVLGPILQTRRTRVARLQEASEGRERVRMARARVNAALEARLGGREVPTLLLRLLDAGWRQYLVLLEMRAGAQAPAWHAGLAVLDRVQLRLMQQAGPDDAAVAELVGTIERCLLTVNVDADLLATFLVELGASLNGAPAAGSGTSVFVPSGRLAAQPEGADVYARLADRLRIGDWWMFRLDGGQVPMQLIWMSQPPFSCTFANRSATRKLDFTLGELSQQVRSGRAQAGRDLGVPLLDRSEYALFDDSYRDLAQQALHDPLTGLPNRKGFMQRLQQQPAPADAGRIHMVGVIEFDQFRLIQNACGEQAMERLVRDLANRIRALMGPGALVAAFRDDTLALMLPDCSRSDGCAKVKVLLNEVRDYPFTHGTHSYRIGFHLGLAEFDPDRHSAAETVRRADSACLTARSLGRNQVQVYEQDTARLQKLESLMGWAGRIDRYLQGEGLFLRCQKVMPTGSSTAHKPYCEILLGVDDGAGGTIPPDQFIPAVEHLQRAHELDIWVIGEVFAWIRDNRPAFDAAGGVAINLSARSLGNPELADFLKTQLALGDVPADRLMFEITETAAIASYGTAQEFIRDIRRHGCKFSLDDFGSGFTSYSHLKNLRTDTLKIDGSFVKDMLQSPADYAMVKSMNDIAHSLGLTTVAEYVETPELVAALEAIGVDYVQGFAVHMPCRLDAFVP